MSFSPIAIVGRACVLPGALSPAALWERVRAGADLISRAPPGRWRLRHEPVTAAAGAGVDAAWTDRGGYVAGFDAVFDPSGFAVPAALVQQFDPLARWLLHVAREALREAGVEGGPRVAAVFGNLSFPSVSFARFAERAWLGPALAAAAVGPVDARNRFMSGLPVHLVAQALGLGPAFALDAACASSLYAIKLACDMLHDRRADVALAGAVNAADDLFIHIGFTALQALSRSGRSRPFHREADGLLPAEGAGAVALKRLEDARAAGNRIYGVIRGIGLANDGRGRGLLAPTEEGQERAMGAAYAAAGLLPSDISLLECHATGTAVGDAVEVRSAARVFAAAADVPIGSLKSNFGHAVTAAGIAGLLKVIGALTAGERPPTLHADDPLALLAGTPLRLLHEVEPWECRGVRRGAVSAFGFGGANAHLIIEEPGDYGRAARTDRCASLMPDSSTPTTDNDMIRWDRPPCLSAQAGTPLPPSGWFPGLRAQPTSVPTCDQPARSRHSVEAGAGRKEHVADVVEIAVVGIGAAVGAGRTAADFAAALFADDAPSTHRATTLFLPVVGTRFPPNDLAAALPQQIWTMAAAREALAGVTLPPPERSGVMIGMGCDPAVARYGARWRLAAAAAAWGVMDETWIHHAADILSPVLTGAGVLGTMPNLPANRLNVQFDLAGPGFTISAEELSGIRALQVALRALRAGELDLALAGAADFSCDPVHEAAACELGLPGPSGDGAVVFALKRLADARRDGDRVLALVDEVHDVGEADEPIGAAAADFGDAAVAARCGRAHAAFGLVRVLAAVTACAAGRRPGGRPWPGERRADLDIRALGGQRLRVGVRAADMSAVELPVLAPAMEPVTEYHAYRPPPVLPALPVMPIAQQPAPVLESVAVLETMRPADELHAAAENGRKAIPPAATMLPAPALARLDNGELRAPVASRPSSPAIEPAGIHVQGALAQIASQVALAARVHRAFLEDQSAAHRRFLEFRERTSAALLAAASDGTRKQTCGADSKSSPARSPANAPFPAVVKGQESAALVAGIVLDRRALEIHASGRISQVFGPGFADLDVLLRRVRMPAPPLLLADRVIRLEAQPLTLGTGTVWTETDIAPGAWYLHENRIPAGILIEAGQADLLLVSWLGVDALNRGERVYRLLGCELTYHGGLPAAGETLRYEIGVEGHAQQGAVRLFFFHSTCTSAGIPRLTVRGGQAGFFTDEELAGSTGVLWEPAHLERREGARVDPPPLSVRRARLSREQLEAFAAGRADECFGPGFEGAAAHTRTPSLPDGRLLLLEQVTDIAVGGGPWGRGYLRAVDRIDPDDWFFEGHFTNDPCMPGTLMFEGGLQAMAVYLAALGFTLERDGWRFEPVPDEPYRMRCRGQVTPASRELVYEIFVEELSAGPEPTLFADILCSVDGLKAFHCRRMGLRLVPGWPLDSRRELLDAIVEERPAASEGDLRFDGQSLLACAWGQPSAAFGPAYRAFDGVRRLARLPGPPYQFMSRVTRLEGEMGGMREGCAVEVEYDIPGDAWYFAANGARTMPFAVLLEVALQPCGWLATWAGSPLTTERDLSFRNLDGDGRLLAEVFPGDGRLRTRAVLTRISRSAGMLIESFEVTCSVGERLVYELKTVFGYFPAEALARQVGLPASAEEREALAAAECRKPGSPSLGPVTAGAGEIPGAKCEESIDLHSWRGRGNGEGPRLAVAPLLMLDRVTGIWPAGGPAGLGRYRAETDVDPAAWFFKAHFFQDPVQPGSLGLEAMLQLLQFAMIHGAITQPSPAGRGQGEGNVLNVLVDHPIVAQKRQSGGVASPGGAARFEPLALGEPHSWKYRGQVLPRNRRVTTLLDLVRTGEDDRGPLAVADASLWVDGTKIYEAKGLAMRIVRDTKLAAASEAVTRAYNRDENAGPVAETASTMNERAATAHLRAGSLKPPSSPFFEGGKRGVAARGKPGQTESTRKVRCSFDERALDGGVVRSGGGEPAAVDEEVLDPAVDTWLQDHCPTWTVPALPLMSMVDRLARAAASRAPGMRVVAVEDARALRWVPVTGPLRLKTEVAPAGEGAFEVTLLAWRDAVNESLSRFEPIATGRVLLAPDRSAGTDLKSVPTSAESTPDGPWDPPSDTTAAPDPYESGTLFHGPSFQLLRALRLAPGASSSLLDAAGGGAPRGLLHEALLDALTHGIPHDRLSDWSPEIPADRVAYPHRIVSLRLFAPLPVTGEVRCETRFGGFDGTPRFPRFKVQAIAGGQVIARLDLVEVLLPKGALGSAPPRERRAFLRDHLFVPGLRLSSEKKGTTRLSESEVRASDWLPGTLALAYAADGDLPGQIAVKEHVAARAAVHPASVVAQISPVAASLDAAGTAGGAGGAGGAGAGADPGSGRCPSEPLTVWPLIVERMAEAVAVRDAGPPAIDLSLVREWWDGYYRIGRWPVEDIYFGLAERFVRRVRLEDPMGFAALRGKGVLYLANHQVGIESILFSLIASTLSGILTVTLAKIEHRTTWLGNLIRHAFAWPGAHDPGVITYFDRSNREELPRIIGVLAREIAGGGKSVMVHVEGTRALTCRAPVQKMSGAFIDMAIATGAPVVPVRFAGGLPVEPAVVKLEYPLGMGGQQIMIGTAILPAELAALPYKERKERVIDAINGLGPAASAEAPLPPDPEFAAAAEEWAVRTGASPEHAALFETMRRLKAPGEEMSRLLAGARAGRLALRDDPQGRWLAELARRLYGPHGPEVASC